MALLRNVVTWDDVLSSVYLLEDLRFLDGLDNEDRLSFVYLRFLSDTGKKLVVEVVVAVLLLRNWCSAGSSDGLPGGFGLISSSFSLVARLLGSL